MARDQSKFMGVEVNNLEGGEVAEILQRYDQKESYYIRSETQCVVIMSLFMYIINYWALKVYLDSTASMSKLNLNVLNLNV